MAFFYKDEDEKKQTFMYKNGDLTRFRLVYVAALVGIFSLWKVVSTGFSRIDYLGLLAASAVAMIWLLSAKCKVCGARYMLRYINAKHETNFMNDIMYSKVCLNESCPSRASRDVSVHAHPSAKI